MTAGALSLGFAAIVAAFLLIGAPLSVATPIEATTFAVGLPAAVGAWGATRMWANRPAAAVRRLEMLDRVGSEIVWECDAGGRFTYVSPQSLEQLRYTPAEVQSLNVTDVVHPDEREGIIRLLAAGHGWWRRPVRCVTKDGTDVWLRSTAVARWDKSGTLVGLSGASHLLGDGPSDVSTMQATSAAVRALLHSDGIRIAFQPIFSLRAGRMEGVEALSRFSLAGVDRTTQDWFTDAARVGLGVDLELRALDMALESAVTLPDHLYVSVNLSPETLLSPGLAEALTGASIHPSRIVVEVTEQTPVEDYARLVHALSPLRQAGIRIAVDDAGAGYACFRHILYLNPDVIKLDRTLITGIDTDPARRALAAAVVTFAHDVRATIVAEGIERPGELEAALALGVDTGQGYLLGRPSTSTAEWLTWHGQGQVGHPDVMASGGV